MLSDRNESVTISNELTKARQENTKTPLDHHSAEALKKDHISKLPNNLIFKILSNLKPETIVEVVSLMSKKFYTMSKDNIFWLNKFLRHFERAFPTVILANQNLFEPKDIQEINWRKEFFERCEIEYRNSSVGSLTQKNLKKSLNFGLYSKKVILRLYLIKRVDPLKYP